MHKIASRFFRRISPLTVKTHPMMTVRNSFMCSQVAASYLDKGFLMLRNSQTLEIKLMKLDSQLMSIYPVSVQISTHATLKDLSQALENQFSITNIKYFSQENIPYSDITPVESLVNRFFTIFNKQNKIKIEGQLLHADDSQTKQLWRQELRESLKQIEHPIFVQRQIESYINRVDTWLDARYGLNNESAVIQASEAQDILVQALVDPTCPWSTVRQIEAQWRQMYNSLQLLKQKYAKAVDVSTRMAKRRMYLDLLMIMGNIAFIWGGTYVVYSWDIIQPWAYFISSAAGIYLFRKAVQFRKPFSLQNYRHHLIYEVYLKKAAQQVGLNLEQYEHSQKELRVLEATFKDYLIKKL